MRVWIDGSIYGLQRVGGISRYFTEIIARLPQHAPECELLVELPARPSPLAPGRGPRVRLVRPPGLRPRRFFSGPEERWARRVLLAARPSVFHSTYFTEPPAAGTAGMRRVATVYDFVYERHGAMLGERDLVLRKRAVLEGADRVIAISETTRDDVLRFTSCPPERVSVAAPGVREIAAADVAPWPEVAARWLGWREPRPFWLYVGRRDSYKNFSIALRALARLARETDHHLVAVGGTPTLEPWEIDYAVRHRVEERVHVLTGVPDADLWSFYGASSAYVATSLWEGFGIPLVEAMQCGAPVVSSDIAASREVAAAAALFFDPHSPDELAERLREVGREATRARLVAAGRARVGAFRWEPAAAEHARVYRELA
jgi:glycosyltransferase involved in cell wall biosynthesis